MVFSKYKRIARLSFFLTLIYFPNNAFPSPEDRDGEARSLEVIVDPTQPLLPFDGGLKEGQVALTFDDGPDPVTTRKILQTLKKFGVKAVFFEVGRMVQSAPEVTREILEQGHSLGSHTWDHSDLSTLPFKDAVENIERGHTALEEAAGGSFHTPFFRFPRFSSTPELMKGLQDLGLTPFFANIITEDWLTPDPKQLLAKSLAAVNAQKKGIILFHDIRPQTADMLDAFLTELIARGYKTVVFRPKPTLASRAAARGIRIGTFFFSSDPAPKFGTAVREFNMYTLPVFFKLVEAKENRFDFSMPDKVADAAPLGTVFFVPALIWNELLPDWLKNGKYTAEQLTAILKKYVTTVIEHFNTKYPGKVIGWEVASEVLSWQGPGGFWHKIGLDVGLDQYEYIRIAFRAAREAAPRAKLHIEDFGVEGLGPKSDRFFKLVADLKAQDIPIDGVGLESHFMIGPGGAFPEVHPSDEIKRNLERFASLGLETMITQADISICNDKKICKSEVSAVTLREQARAYRKLIRACVSAKGCKAFTTWGVGDKGSWIMQFFPGWGAPLLFDSLYNPKPAYDAVAAELSGCAGSGWSRIKSQTHRGME